MPRKIHKSRHTRRPSRVRSISEPPQPAKEQVVGPDWSRLRPYRRVQDAEFYGGLGRMFLYAGALDSSLIPKPGRLKTNSLHYDEIEEAALQSIQGRHESLFRLSKVIRRGLESSEIFSESEPLTARVGQLRQDGPDLLLDIYHPAFAAERKVLYGLVNNALGLKLPWANETSRITIARGTLADFDLDELRENKPAEVNLEPLRLPLNKPNRFH